MILYIVNTLPYQVELMRETLTIQKMYFKKTIVKVDNR